MNFYNLKISFSLDKESFTRINYRPFLAGMIAVIIMKMVMIMGFEPPTFLTPIPDKVEKFDSIQPKLEQKINEFKLTKENSFIPAAFAAGDYDNATAYVVVDLDTGKVILDKNMNEELSIASITKVMTAVVALDLASPDEVFTITENAANQIPTKIGIVPGERMKLQELLEASLLTSANDATEAIKDGIDHKYGEAVFIRAMNEKAEFIGMKNTHFTNVQGFDNEKHYSTPEDLALLAHYSLNEYPLIRDIVKRDYLFIQADQDHKQFDLYNWNGLLGVYPNVYGIKIGNTDDAGVTTMVAAEREGKNIGVILLGSPGVLERDLWAAQLLDIGFETELGLKPVNLTEDLLREKYSTWNVWN